MPGPENIYVVVNTLIVNDKGRPAPDKSINMLGKTQQHKGDKSIKGKHQRIGR